MLAIIQAHEYQQKLALQAQKLNEHLATLEINKRREYLRQGRKVKNVARNMLST